MGINIHSYGITATAIGAHAGGLIGYNLFGDVVIENCYVNGDVTAISSGGSAYAGGLIGFSWDDVSVTIKNSHATGNIFAITLAYSEPNRVAAYAGGLIGLHGGEANIADSYTTGTISASASDDSLFANAYVGGLIGACNMLTVENSYTTGTISASASAPVANAIAGGIAGVTVFIMKNSYATGTITATSSGAAIAGGLIGNDNGGIVDNCYSTGNIIVSGAYGYAGGLIGISWGGTIVNSYNTGNIIGTATSVIDTTTSELDSVVCVGGLIGSLSGNGDIETVVNSYATGNIIVTSIYSEFNTVTVYAGGLIGAIDDNPLVIVNSYTVGAVIATTHSVVGATIHDCAYAGGLIGKSAGTVTIVNSYAAGSVIATATFTYVSGIVFAESIVSSSGSGTDDENGFRYTAVTTMSTSGNAYAGGLIGQIEGAVKIESSFVMGDVTAIATPGGAYAGDLVGNRGTLDVTNCYLISGTEIIGKTLTKSACEEFPREDLRELLSVIGWDTTIWTINPDGLPYLIGLTQPSPEKTLISAAPSAFVTKLNGNKNGLTITVTERFSDGTTKAVLATFSIDNNAAGTYQVGDYRVYVDTKGNTQIRTCYIVE